MFFRNETILNLLFQNKIVFELQKRTFPDSLKIREAIKAMQILLIRGEEKNMKSN